MKNIELWRPSKFLLINGAPKANGRKIYPGSLILISILAREYFNVISKYAKGRLLDLGCGNVPLYSYYKDLIGEIICVDWENSYHENIHLDYQFDLNKPFPKKIGKFDTVLTTDVLEHILEPDIFFSEISKSLNSGGKLILSTPFFYWLHEQPYDFNRYTEYKLRDLCKKNNLKVLDLYPYGGVYEVLADILSKIMSNRKVVIKLFNRITPSILSRKGISNKYPSKFPLGYILIADKNKS